MKHKRPNPYSRFAYARIPERDGVIYRLSRRDFRGTLHFYTRKFDYTDPRSLIASTLRIARKELLARVDDIELALMGMSA